jgi:hypothetical protein
MTSIYVPSGGPEDWQWLLAQPGLHWKHGYSAMALADAWEAADPWPPVVRDALDRSDLAGLELLLGLPEHEVPLAGGSTASQTDLFVLARHPSRGLVSVAVEGKAEEPFGETVGEWRSTDSPGKQARLAQLLGLLGLADDDAINKLRYQLLHRTASALIEARRFGASDALMLVHSFSPSHTSFGDFEAFCAGLGAPADIGEIHPVDERDGIQLHVGWVSDTPAARPAPPHLGHRFDRALRLARELHAEQHRKGSEIPYLAHLLGVTSLVLEDGGSEDEAIAALLHDAVEDQGGPKTLNVIRQRFGRRVADIVDGCSDTDATPKPPWKERKQAYIDHLATADSSVVRVSLADKLHNARAILFDLAVVGDALWDRFSASRADTVWYYESLVCAFADRSGSPMVPELRRVVADIVAWGRDAAPASG